MTTGLPSYDPAAPMDGLARAGVSTKKSTTLSIEGAHLSASTGDKWQFTLPAPAAVRASFTKEGIGKKLVKLFTKELQAGDPAFDDDVYVTTSDMESTGRFLGDEDVRKLIAGFVSGGGAVEIDGASVTVYVVSEGGGDVVSEKDVARFVCHVMAFA